MAGTFLIPLSSYGCADARSVSRNFKRMLTSVIVLTVDDNDDRDNNNNNNNNSNNNNSDDKNVAAPPAHHNLQPNKHTETASTLNLQQLLLFAMIVIVVFCILRKYSTITIVLKLLR